MEDRDGLIVGLRIAWADGLPAAELAIRNLTNHAIPQSRDSAI